MFELLLTIAMMGFMVWVILQIPMPQPFRNIIVGIVCIALVIWLLGGLTGGGFPRLRLLR